MAKRDYILHNFWWKVTSFLLAVIVWFVVYGANRAEGNVIGRERTFSNHSLAVLRDATDKRPIRVTPSDVTISVSAPVLEVTRLTDTDIQTFIDLNEIDPSRKKAPIHVYVPRGVKLEKIIPDEVTVEFIE
jgi:YbbR domain-containing protein